MTVQLTASSSCSSQAVQLFNPAIRAPMVVIQSSSPLQVCRNPSEELLKTTEFDFYVSTTTGEAITVRSVRTSATNVSCTTKQTNGELQADEA